jgi:DnaJ family protein B protein 4
MSAAQREQTLYDTLGVSNTASLDEIKKAYRKLSFVHHPDKNNNAPESTILFQAIAEAYAVLSDPVSRENYDMEQKYGFKIGNQASSRSHARAPNINSHELFNMLFGGLGGGVNGGMNVDNVALGGLGGLGGLGNIFQSLSGMGCAGGEIHIIHGGGGGSGFGGFGGFNQIHPMFMHQQQQQQQQQQQPCKQKLSSDRPVSPPIHDDADTLPDPIMKSLDLTFEQVYMGGTAQINYEQLVYENKTMSSIKRNSLTVTIPRGARHNEKIIIPNIGNVAASGKCGDVHLSINVLPHAVFARGGDNGNSRDDLILHKQITLKDSLCGVQFEFTHINGKAYQIVNKSPGTVLPPESVKTIKGLGFERDDGSPLGSLQIIFHVTYPETISAELYETLSSIL